MASTIVELSGVCGDGDLLTSLSSGQPPQTVSLNSGYYLWPEVNPGWFRAGSGTCHAGLDYLFSRESRLVLGPTSGLAMASQEISRLHGPTVAAYYPLASTGASSGQALLDAQSGWPARSTGWSNMVYAPCRDRFKHLIPTWTLFETLSDGSRMYVYNIPAEQNGWGPTGQALPMRLSDTQEDWNLLGSYEDLKFVGNSGAKEWGTSSGAFVIKCSSGTAAPSGLMGSWIAGQASFDWEESAVSTSLGVPLTVPSLDTFFNVQVQYAWGTVSATGASLNTDGTFPRYASVPGLPANTRVIVRYRPTGVYGITPGVNGGVVAVSLAQQSLVCVRYESSSPEEKFAAGRDGNRVNALSPTTSPPGYFIGIAPGHALHPTAPGPGIQYGTIPNGARVLAWCIPGTIYTHGTPAKVRAMVLGPDGAPIPGATVKFVPGAYLYASSLTATTSLLGECFIELTRVDSGNGSSNLSGTSSITVQIWNAGILIDQQVLTITLGSQLLVSDWVTGLCSGLVYLNFLPGRARSGVSTRRRVALWRRSADGSPCDGSLGTVTVVCDNGRLFPEPASVGGAVNNTPGATISNNSAGGKLLVLTPSQSSENWADSPIYFEYEPPTTGEQDVIHAAWLPYRPQLRTSFGRLVVGSRI